MGMFSGGADEQPSWSDIYRKNDRIKELEKQLADTMRENERLLAKIEGMEGAAAIERLYAEDQRNKESDAKWSETKKQFGVGGAE